MHIRQPVTVEKTPEKIPKLVHNVHYYREKKKPVSFFKFLNVLAWEKRRLRDSTKA